MWFYDDCGNVMTDIGVNGTLLQGGQNGGFTPQNFTLSPTGVMGLARDPDNFIRLMLRTADEEFDHLVRSFENSMKTHRKFRWYLTSSTSTFPHLL
jgi:hypothetical protein